MATVRRDTPQNYTGGREVFLMKVPCGWCMDKMHEKCKHEMAYYEKLWLCGCECNKDWTPVDVGSYQIVRAVKKEEEELPDDLPDVRVTADTGSDPSDEDPRGDLLDDHDGDAAEGSDPVGSAASSDDS